LNLEQILRESEGIKAAVFHEGLSIIERDRAAAYFAEQDNSAQVLLCSEIGSEGRNFQFSHHLILFDLPLNPDLLEQRIGRLDRIGQKNDINIHVPYFINTAQEVLFKWYHNALQAFEYTLTTGQVLYSEHRPTLLELVAEHTTEDAVLEPFLQTVYDQNQALKEKMEQGRDRLLELHSKGQGRSEQLMKDIEELDNQTLLPMFMFKIFDIFGIAQADRGENAIVLKPTEHMLTPSFPCLRDEGLTVTFDRNTALAQEDVHFISWDHPMVQDVMSLVIDDDIGTTSVALLKNKQLPAGSFFVELIYLAETSAPKALQMGRFFPSTPVRLLLDKNGNDLAQNVAFDAFNQQLNAVGKQTASKLATALQTSVHPLIEKANEIAKEQLASLKANAKQKVEVQLVEELDRLKSLMQINPSVREDEVNYLATQKATLHEHAEKAELKLDSIRLIVVSH
jgi:ATP-dependent helicase HepA